MRGVRQLLLGIALMVFGMCLILFSECYVSSFAVMHIFEILGIGFPMLGAALSVWGFFRR